MVDHMVTKNHSFCFYPLTNIITIVFNKSKCTHVNHTE